MTANIHDKACQASPESIADGLLESQVKDRISSLQTEKSQLKKTVSHASAELTQNRKKVQELCDSLAQTKLKLASLSAERDSEKQAEKLKLAKLTQLQKTVTDMKTALKEAELGLEKADRELIETETHSQEAAHRDSLQKLEESVWARQEQIESIKVNIGKERRRFKSKSSEIVDLEIALSSITSDTPLDEISDPKLRETMTQLRGLYVEYNGIKKAVEAEKLLLKASLETPKLYREIREKNLLIHMYENRDMHQAIKSLIES